MHHPLKNISLLISLRHSPLYFQNLRVLRRSDGDVVQADEDDDAHRYDSDTSRSTSEYFNCHDVLRFCSKLFRSASI